MQTITHPNQLPVIIDGPGEYIARSGARVLITEVHSEFRNRGEFMHFDAKGYYYLVTPTKNGNAKRKRWMTWHVCGMSKAVGEHPRDVVKKA